jgi:hypothetical protein
MEPRGFLRLLARHFVGGLSCGGRLFDLFFRDALGRALLRLGARAARHFKSVFLRIGLGEELRLRLRPRFTLPHARLRRRRRSDRFAPRDRRRCYVGRCDARFEG